MNAKPTATDSLSKRSGPLPPTGQPLAPLGINLPAPPAPPLDYAAPHGPWRGSRVGRYTFARHRWYSMLEGAAAGFMLPTVLSYFLVRSLDEGDDKELYATLIHWLPAAAALLSPLFLRPGQSTRGYWLFAGVFGRLVPAALFVFAERPWQVVGLVTLSAVLCTGITPAQNSLFGRNYSESDRARYYGYAKLFHIPMLIGASLAFGYLVDLDPAYSRIALPLGGVLAFAGYIMFYLVKIRHIAGDGMPGQTIAAPITSHSPLSYMRRFIRPFVETVTLFKRNRYFAVYELGFFLYGLSFMMLLPVVPVLYDRIFNVKHSEFAMHASMVFYGVMFCCHLILRGRHGTWSAARVGGTAFTLLVFYPASLLLAVVTHQIWFAVVGFVVYGVGMTLVDYAWNLGPIRFAGGRDAMPFTTAHSTLVGLRAAIAYPIIYGIMKANPGEFYFALVIPSVLMIVAVMTMFWLDAAMRRAPGSGGSFVS